jgi:hypothetical protein
MSPPYKNTHGKKPGAMPFVGALYRQEEAYRAAMEGLKSLFGPVLMETEAIPWEYSLYYREELGWPISRRFAFFGTLVNEEELPDVKLRTISLEAALSREGRRTVNLDPGYLTPAKVVLASTKDYSHRIYLDRGIYAEVTLIFMKGRFHPHLNTYRDYRDHAEVFSRARDALMKRGHGPPP